MSAETKKPKVESHDCGRLVYFNNVLVRNDKLNSHTNYEYWKKVAEENPNFCPRQFHESLKCKECNCKIINNE